MKRSPDVSITSLCCLRILTIVILLPFLCISISNITDTASENPLNITETVLPPVNISKINSCPAQLDGHGASYCGCTETNEGISVGCASIYGQLALTDLLESIQNVTIHRIALTGGQITQLQRSILRHLTLQQLHLEQNSLQFLQSDSLPHTLYSLNLAGNLLITPNHQALRGLEKLENLNLGCNLLGDLEDNSFPILPSLLHLDLSCNSICRLTPYALNGTNSQLASLNFDHNCFSRVPSMGIRDYPRLLSLSMRYNRIETLQPLDFLDFPRLQTLLLSGNQISGVLQPLTFVQLPALRQLALDGNNIQVLNPGVFQNTERLEIIDLSFNDIAVIGKGVLANLNHLKSVNLAGNRIRHIHTLAFLGNAQLVSVQMEQNCLSEVVTIFNESPGLHTIWLANNSLTKVDPQGFASLSNLQTLDLSHNYLGVLDVLGLALPGRALYFTGNPAACTLGYDSSLGQSAIPTTRKRHSKICRDEFFKSRKRCSKKPKPDQNVKCCRTIYPTSSPTLPFFPSRLPPYSRKQSTNFNDENLYPPRDSDKSTLSASKSGIFRKSTTPSSNGTFRELLALIRQSELEKTKNHGFESEAQSSLLHNLWDAFRTGLKGIASRS